MQKKLFTIKLHFQFLKPKTQQTPIHHIDLKENTTFQQFYRLVNQKASDRNIKYFRIVITARDNLILTEQKFQDYLQQLPKDIYCRYLTVQEENQLHRTVYAYKQSKNAWEDEGVEQGAQIIQPQKMAASKKKELKTNQQLELNSQKLSDLLNSLHKKTNIQPKTNRKQFIKSGNQPFFSNKQDLEFLSTIGIIESRDDDTMETIEQTRLADLIIRGLKTYYGPTGN